MMTGAARERRGGADRKNKGHGANGRTKASIHVNLLVSDRRGSKLSGNEQGFKGVSLAGGVIDWDGADLS